MLLAASDPKALWYLTRGFGLVSLVLLTISVALGVAELARFARPGLPRFLIAGLHRNASLLAVLLLIVHVVTAIADPFAPIRLVDAFIPFAGAYRPLWLGFGALASDLLLALVITSLLRQRIGYPVWRAVHWCAYASWPVALVHGLGTGSDSRLGLVQFVYAVCLAAVLAAVGWRLATRWSGATSAQRLVAGLSTVLVLTIVSAWAAQGPLRSGWAKRAGTPPSLLGTSSAHPTGSTHR